MSFLILGACGQQDCFKLSQWCHLAIFSSCCYCCCCHQPTHPTIPIHPISMPKTDSFLEKQPPKLGIIYITTTWQPAELQYTRLCGTYLRVRTCINSKVYYLWRVGKSDLVKSCMQADRWKHRGSRGGSTFPPVTGQLNKARQK